MSSLAFLNVDLWRFKRKGDTISFLIHGSGVSRSIFPIPMTFPDAICANVKEIYQKGDLKPLIVPAGFMLERVYGTQLYFFLEVVDNPCIF